MSLLPLAARDDIISCAPVSGNLYECGPLFIDELSILLCASGSLIQAISSKTGELIGNFCGHSAAVTCISNCPTPSIERENGNGHILPSKSSPLVVSTSIDGCIIVWNKKTFKEVSRTETAFTLFEIIVPSASKCPFLHGIPLPECVAESTSITEYGQDRADCMYLVVDLPPIVDANNREDARRERGGGSQRDRDSGKANQVLILYSTQEKKIIERIATVQGRQCTVSIGSVLADVYIVAATVNPTVQFYAERADRGPSMHLQSGPASCLATVEGSGKLVTGHCNGEIMVYHNIIPWLEWNTSVKFGGPPPPCTKFHWHVHAVYSMALSPDGSYLYSGAEEAVLVVWQLGTGIKDFVPRLGGDITFLSASTKEAKVAVTTADNVVRIVNISSMKEEWELRSLFLPRAEVSNYDKSHRQRSRNIEVEDTAKFMQADVKYRCSIRIEGRSGHLVCNGYPGELQTMDLTTQTFKARHEIVQFQRITRKETFARVCVPTIMHYNFLDTPHGSYMVTVDVRRGEESDAEASLKFWEWNAQQSKYCLSVQVDRPHGSSKVTAAVFCPSSSSSSSSSSQTPHPTLLNGKKKNITDASSQSITCSCTTAAINGSIKIWLGQYQNGNGNKDSNVGSSSTGMRWTCSFSFTHRDSPVGSLSYSFDGSLLAVTYQNVVTLWDPAQVMLWKSVVIPSRYNIIFTAFIEPRASAVMGGGAGEALLVVGSKRCLSVYNLINMKVVWCVEGNYSCFAVARDESSTIHCGDISNDKSDFKKNPVAWIAASVKRGRNDKMSEEAPNKIVLFGCYSPERLSVIPSYPRVTSMTFWSNQKDMTASLSSGLLCLTAHGELLIVGPVEAMRQQLSDRSLSLSSTQPAKTFGVKVPAIAFSAVVNDYNQSNSSESSAVIRNNLSASVLQQNGSTALPKNWLGTIFDAKSSTIPSLSLIYDDFVKGLINKQQVGRNGARPFSSQDIVKISSVTAPATSTSNSDASSSTSNKIRKREHSLGGEETVKSACFSDKRSEMFSVGLTAFFSEFLKFNTAPVNSANHTENLLAPAPLVSATPLKRSVEKPDTVNGSGASLESPIAISTKVKTPKDKSASKTKKSEKRKADALQSTSSST